jgi:hypothetical protein
MFNREGRVEIGMKVRVAHLERVRECSIERGGYRECDMKVRVRVAHLERVREYSIEHRA